MPRLRSAIFSTNQLILLGDCVITVIDLSARRDFSCVVLELCAVTRIAGIRSLVERVFDGAEKW